MGALGDWYHQHIVEPGKQPLFLLLVAFVVTFLFTRLSVRMIRKGVKWWPGNVTAGDTHVHHVIFGITVMLIAGIGAFTPAGGNEPWWDVLAVLFGIGAALVLDEFALVLHLKDVYWAEQGRQSVNAVVIAAAVTTMLILGALPLGVDDMTIGENTGLWGYVATLALNFVLVVLALLKGRLWLGILGLLVPLLALIAVGPGGATEIAVRPLVLQARLQAGAQVAGAHGSAPAAFRRPQEPALRPGRRPAEPARPGSVIKYLGSKRALVPVLGDIASAVRDAVGAKTALDLFTGTTRVAQELKRRGLHVTAADSASYSRVLADCYIATDAAQVPQAGCGPRWTGSMPLAGRRGYVTEVFCEKARYFQPKNGMRIDAVRDAIERDYAGSRLYPILLTALMLAADRVDSTTGVQMAYLKRWAPRAYNDLQLRAPTLLDGPGRAVLGEAADVVDEVGDVDFAYLDPPYNQHSYRANYHVWETLIRWDDPPHYGVACKRADVRDPASKSPFNRRAEHARGPAPGHRAGAGAHPRRLLQRRIVAGPRATSCAGFGRRPVRATCACWPSTPSATSARRSASTTRAGARSDRSPTCATSSTCSSPGPRPPSRPR